MPLYEYRCTPCDHTFETLVRSSNDQPHCPKCGETHSLTKQFSIPAAAHTQASARASSTPLPMAGGCGAPACCGGGCALD